MTAVAKLAERWRAELAAWAIPPAVQRSATASPWVSPSPPPAGQEPSGPTQARALEALRDPGAVLDVGAGEGAASLPLSGAATTLAAVDERGGALAELAARAARVRLPVTLYEGRWPDLAGRVPAADVVVCAHVLYNVPDLVAFVTALTDHARRRVVCELTEAHPLTALNPLWRRFHGLERPEGPSAADAIAVLRALGLDLGVERWSRPASRYGSFEERVEVTRRRLCLPPERTGEVAAALVEQDALVEPVRRLVTLCWAGEAPSR